jgi:Flp pilus assembly protein TadD
MRISSFGSGAPAEPLPLSTVDDAEAWHALGVALAALGHRAGAVTALRNAILLNDERPQTQLALGKLLFDAARVEDALRCFECAAAGNPSVAVRE